MIPGGCVIGVETRSHTLFRTDAGHGRPEIHL